MDLFHNHAESAGVSQGHPVVSKGIILLCLLISLAGIGNHDLWTPDEPREAALALNMSRTGDWLIPSLAGEAFVEKPPLFYIVASFFLSGLGSVLGNTAALRLTSALWGLATLGMTYLIGRRLWGARSGLLAMLILAVMPGFVHLTHWLLVDNALMFFVTAAFWCLTEAYLAQRLGFLALAGACAGGAFLAKGLIGPVMIAIGGVGLLGPWIRQCGWTRLFAFRSLAWHVLALTLLAGLAGAWMLALRRYGGEGLWREWFWNNHIGRFTGQATQLGHRGWVGYYLPVLPLYLLPWLAAWLAGLGGALRRLRRRESVGLDWSFLLWWGLGGLVLLSLSSTKREIYLAPLLPAFALMVASALRDPLSAWVRVPMKIWLWLLLAAMALLVVAPVFGYRLGMSAGECVLYSALALVSAVIAFVVFSRRGLPWLWVWWLITALTYSAVLTIIVPILDRVKSYGPGFRDLAQQLVSAPEARLAAWQFDETTRAGFYYYCDLVFPAVSNTVELYSIFSDEYASYNGVLTLAKRFPPAKVDLPVWHVAGEARLGSNRRLLWVMGDTEGTNGTVRNEGWGPTPDPSREGN